MLVRAKRAGGATVSAGNKNTSMTKIIAISLLMTLTAFSQSLPPQFGFTWWKIPALKGALLVPNGWHKKETIKDGALAYFVTKTKIIDKKNGFKVGLTLNVFKDFQKTHGKEPLAWAKQYRQAASSKSKVLDTWDKNMGPFKSIGLQAEYVRGGQTLMTHQLFILNPKTGTLYFYIFESPKAEWNNEWKHGEKMLKLLMIDDEV